MEFPNVKNQSLHDIWYNSFGFNRYRGYEWMQEPCRSCDEKEKDFGGCRCQAYMLTGSAEATDPVCSKSPHHNKILAARNESESASNAIADLQYRNEKNSKQIDAQRIIIATDGGPPR